MNTIKTESRPLFFLFYAAIWSRGQVNRLSQPIISGNRVEPDFVAFAWAMTRPSSLRSSFAVFRPSTTMTAVARAAALAATTETHLDFRR